LLESLSVPPVIADREKVTIDEEVLDEVAQKLGEIDREEAIEAITSGTMNPVTVAYFLILDNKMKNILKSKYQNAQNANNNGSNPALIATSPQQKFSIEMVLDQRAAFQDKESTQIVGVNHFTNVDNLRIDMSDQAKKNKYHLGLRIVKPTAADTMKEVYYVLKTMHMKWKVIGQFGLKCKYSHTKVPHKDVILILQLYKLPEGGYLLDLSRTGGNIFSFYDTCQEFFDLYRNN